MNLRKSANDKVFSLGQVWCIIAGVVFGCEIGWFFKIRRQGVENHRKSKIKRRRKSGFLVRMRTSKGRKMINRKRRVGRSVSVRKTMK